MNDTHNHDDRVHAMFAQVADDPAPPLSFTADGIAAAGRRGARTRRLAAVGGTTAGIAAVGIAVAALPGAVGQGRATTAAGPTKAVTSPLAAPTSAPYDAVCAADVSAVLTLSDPTGKKVALQECPALRAIDGILDPAGKHLVETDASGRVIAPDIVWGETMVKGKAVATSAGLCYNNQGRASNPHQADCEELPQVFVSVTFSLPGAPDPSQMSSDMTLANRAPGIGTGAAAWIPKSTKTLKDGSTVTVSEVQNGDRVSAKARRVLKSGAALTIVAVDGYDNSSATEQPGSVYDPFPFTLEQMAAAAGVEQFVAPDALLSHN
ncbi:hypothetical protein ABH926_010145 [Catenulispora sp. GP43]|uniref:hypothetical protein n=1 Tax=Catenulispora sp. GP43 TaxID=3156263 RepID=UPI0035144787